MKIINENACSCRLCRGIEQEPGEKQVKTMGRNPVIFELDDDEIAIYENAKQNFEHVYKGGEKIFDIVYRDGNILKLNNKEVIDLSNYKYVTFVKTTPHGCHKIKKRQKFVIFKKITNN